MVEKVFLKTIQSSRLSENTRTEIALPSATICVISIWESFNGSQLIDFMQIQLQNNDLLSSE